MEPVSSRCGADPGSDRRQRGGTAHQVAQRRIAVDAGLWGMVALGLLVATFGAIGGSDRLIARMR